jgi:putative transposase
MKRKRHTHHKRSLRSCGRRRSTSTRATIEVVCRKLEISEQTFHRWRHLYGGIKGPEMAQMKELEKGIAWLTKIMAQQAMAIDALKDLSRKNW